MTKNTNDKSIENVCDFKYLTDLMANKKHLIKGIMDVFLKQVPEDLQRINDAVTETDYAIIKSFSHTMKSSVSIMGISVLIPILQEMEDLGALASDIESIKLLNQKLNLICQKAIEEVEIEKLNFV